ncbi:short-chain dehydrogenase [Pseudomonas fluorescens]|uniref:Short-chain dehydrogenase n=1 Tax=Pseudomonas fluorescens TaxID=294 RepID=A0A1T2Z8H4_PSEFL|nr:SDR family NAD(P)-dependent oxidoreductase [Pseudomonas fluorescens]OPB00337.1 short-chain dehydrogenase [Pseudomonas fluorescens]
MKLIGKTILITGGTRGIGLELATQLLAAGNTVLVTARDAAGLDSVRKALPGVHAFQSDASDPLQIAALYEEVRLRFPTLNVLINNAGIMRNLDLNHVAEPARIADEIAVGLSGPILLTQYFLPLLRQQPAALIVNVSSGLALIPFVIAPVYSAAKAGMHAYTRCLRAQVKNTSVRVVELLPPGTETALFRGEFEKEMKGQKGMPVVELVEQAIKGIEAGRDEIRPGLAKVLGFMSRIAPDFMMAQMARMSAPKA